MAVSSTEQQLRQFKVDFLRASQAKDRATLDRMIHDDFTLVDPEGNEVNKTELINDIVHNQSDFLREFNRHDHRVAFHIEGNVARETAAVRMAGRHARRGDISGNYLNSATYVRTVNGWRMIGNSLHRVAEGDQPGHQRTLSGVAAESQAVPGWGISIVSGEVRVEGDQGG